MLSRIGPVCVSSRHWFVFCLIASAGLAVAATPSAEAGSRHARAEPSAAVAPVSAGDVEKAVQAGANVTKVPSNLRPDLRDADQDAEQIDNDCELGQIKHDATFGECAHGPAKSRRSFIILGDSHAGMWFDGLEQAAILAGWQMRIFYKTGCPAPTLTFYRDPAECNTWRSKAIAAIRKLKPTMVIVTSASYEQDVSKDRVASDSDWRTGLTTTLRRLKGPHTRLVILGDIPILAQSAPECLAAHQSSVQKCATPRTDAVKGVLMDAEAAAAHAVGARRVDVTPWLCATICPPIIHNILVYRNQFHITRTYSLYLAGVLRASLKL